MSEYCIDFVLTLLQDVFEETGCAVCGKLTQFGTMDRAFLEVENVSL